MSSFERLILIKGWPGLNALTLRTILSVENVLKMPRDAITGWSGLNNIYLIF